MERHSTRLIASVTPFFTQVHKSSPGDVITFFEYDPFIDRSVSMVPKDLGCLTTNKS